jgi:hypothetical protein
MEVPCTERGEIEGEDKSRGRTPKEARNSKNELKAKTAVHKPTQIVTDNIETCPTKGSARAKEAQNASKAFPVHARLASSIGHLQAISVERDEIVS